MPPSDGCPNIVFIVTDQQNFRMMSCAGNDDLSTPAMDSLAETGVRYARPYRTNPVCVPSRFSLMTGRYPSAIGMWSNNSRDIPPIPEKFKQQGIGWLLREAGYETVYGGKVHLPKGIKPEEIGFETIEKDERDRLAATTAEYVRADHDRPFFMVASFINPHDICYMAIRDFATSDFDHALLRNGETELAALDAALQRPEGVSDEEFFDSYCPELPPNFQPQEDEPEALRQLLKQRSFRWQARTEWPPERWREHRWAYARLTERVDAQIGVLLNAIAESGQAENTVVIFTSDHGDHDSSHKIEHKTAPYEEAAHIPFLISQPGTTRNGEAEDALVCNGLDLLPTICDYAGAEVPSDLKGRSLRPLAEEGKPDDWREELLVETEIGQALVTDRYKYILCNEGENHEQLMDLVEDPWEIRNHAHDPENEEVLEDLRARFRARV